MKQKIKYYIIILLLITGIIWVGSFNDGSDNNQNKEVVYSDYWRDPNRKELGSIGRLMVQNGVSGCGEYYLKLIGLDEYIVACTRNRKDWDYYVVYIGKNKIVLADEAITSKLTPPK